MEVGAMAGGCGNWQDLAAPNRCLVDLGESEKEELLAVGKEEGREGRHFFLPCLLFLDSLTTKEPGLMEEEVFSGLGFRDVRNPLPSLKGRHTLAV